jgi:uncharacterized membrane protein
VNAAKLVWIGFAIIIVGFLVAALGTFQTQGGSSSSGGIILIGPIPIVFGSGQYSGTIISIAIVLFAVMIVVYLISAFLFWRNGRQRQEAERF